MSEFGCDDPGAGPLVRLEAEETVRRISRAFSGRAAVEAGGFPILPGVGGEWASGNTLLRLVPPWAGEVGVVVPGGAPDVGSEGGAPKEAWLWLSPGFAFAVPGFPSQLVLNLPPGRYAVATWDVKAGQPVGSESAAGGPLVCGPPCPGGPVVVAVRRLAESPAQEASPAGEEGVE